MLGYDINRNLVSMRIFRKEAQALAVLLLINAGAAMAQNCSSFRSCAEAVASYKSGNSKLDRDKDGIPCEKLCGSNGQNMPQQ